MGVLATDLARALARVLPHPTRTRKDTLGWLALKSSTHQLPQKLPHRCSACLRPTLWSHGSGARRSRPAGRRLTASSRRSCACCLRRWGSARCGAALWCVCVSTWEGRGRGKARRGLPARPRGPAPPAASSHTAQDVRGDRSPVRQSEFERLGPADYRQPTALASTAVHTIKPRCHPDPPVRPPSPQAQMGFPDLARAQAAVQRVFPVLDRRPAIGAGQPAGACRQEGLRWGRAAWGGCTAEPPRWGLCRGLYSPSVHPQTPRQ